jgi:hypothetical protein
MTLDERLSEIEHRPTTWTIDDGEDLLALAREYRDAMAEAVEALEMAMKWVEVRHLDNDPAMEEWYLAARAAVEGWPQPTPDTPEQGEACRWRQDRGDGWYTECGYRILGLALRGKPCVCGKPIEIIGGDHA